MREVAGINFVRSRGLLLTAKPWPDETLMGFILRVAELNGYETPAWIIELCGLRYDEIARNCSWVFGRKSDFARLAYLTSVEASELTALGYPPAQSDGTNTRHLFFTSPISKWFIRSTHNKLCPACLRESNYCRKVWDSAGVTACPLHKSLLLDECPNCHRRITWNRKGVSICACEYDFRGTDVQPMEDSELILARHIHRLCGISTFEVGPEDVANNPLAGLSLEDILSAVFLIAGEYQNSYGTKGQRILKGQRNAGAHRLLTKAFAVFEQWPRNYLEFLTWRRQPDVNPYTPVTWHTGVFKDFGKFYMRLHDQFKATRYDFLRVAFNEYLSRLWDGGRVGVIRRVKRASAGGSQYLSGMEAARELGVDWKRFVHFVETGRLKAVVQTQGKKTLFLVDTESLQNLKQEFERFLGMQEVADRIGVLRGTVMKILRQGIIKALSGPTVDGTPCWKFSESVVDDLFRRIRATIPEPAVALTGDELSFTAARRRIGYFALNLTLADFITAVLKGDIRPCGETAEGGLSRFLFKRSAVETYAKLMSRAKPPQ